MSISKLNSIRLPLILVILLVSAPLVAQDTKGIVRPDSLQVYRTIPDTQKNEVATALKRGVVVRVDWSITNGQGDWCSISALDKSENIGFVDCSQLDIQRAGSSATLNQSPTQSLGTTSHRWTKSQKQWALAASAVLTEFNHDRHDTLAGKPITPEYRNQNRRILSAWWDIRSREDLLSALNWIEQGGHRQLFSVVGERASKMSSEESKMVLASLPAEDAHSIVVARRYYNSLGQKGIAGWDYARYISLCRWGYAAGFLSEDEAWENIMSSAHQVQSTFSSWQELGENYLIGRDFWSQRQTLKDGQQMRAAYNRLLNDPASPWIRIPWNLNLD